MDSLKKQIGGSNARAEVGEKDFKTLNGRLYNAKGGWRPNSYGPSELHMESFQMAIDMYERTYPSIKEFIYRVKTIQINFVANGGPTIIE
jgi:hypothetical protein